MKTRTVWRFEVHSVGIDQLRCIIVYFHQHIRRCVELALASRMRLSLWLSALSTAREETNTRLESTQAELSSLRQEETKLNGSQDFR